MSDSQHLIVALRAAAARAEKKPEDYCYPEMACCNCGLVVQELLDITPSDLNDRIHVADRWGGTWEDPYLEQCRQTNLPLPRIFQELDRAGLDAKDLAELECLNNPEVLQRMHVKKPPVASSRGAFVAYATAWADLLEERLAVSA